MANSSQRPCVASDSSWSAPSWIEGALEDPDFGWTTTTSGPETGIASWSVADSTEPLSDSEILKPLIEQLGQTRSKDRVRDLAEVFTHQREVSAMLDLIPDAFLTIDVKFLEPTCGSGNFLVEILSRKLKLVTKTNCVSQQQYEHQLLRVLASIYGVDISPENVTESRARLAHVLLSHFQTDANTVKPSAGFLTASALILGDNVVIGDTLSRANEIELCDWQPRSHGCFQRVWSPALVPEGDRDLFWEERQQDEHPVHYSELSKKRSADITRREGKRK